VKPDFLFLKDSKDRIMKYILGKKLEMTQKFKEDGKVVPVTVVKAGPCFITQVKLKDKDGYKALQVGFGERKKVSKSDNK